MRLQLAALLATFAAALPAQGAPAPARSRLDAIFAGGEPGSVADLRAMQEHVQRLLHDVLPAVVALDGASGVLVRRHGETLVLTSAHVTQYAERRMRIHLHDGRVLRGETLGCDHQSDLGLIRVEGPAAAELPVLDLGSSGTLQRGQWVVMLGHPSGEKDGREAPARLGRVLRPAQRGFVVTDCTMQAGDSGGPLLDMSGAVVGVNSRITGNLAENMHSPVDVLDALWPLLLAGDVLEDPARVRRGLGAKLVTTPYGLRVVELAGAAAGGLREGDVLVELEGRRVRRQRDVERAIRALEIGNAVDAVVRRDGRRQAVRIEIVEERK